MKYTLRWSTEHKAWQATHSFYPHLTGVGGSAEAAMTSLDAQIVCIDPDA